MSSCVPYNAVISVTFSPVTGAEYPVPLADFKRHLNLQFDPAGSYEFNDDDTYLQAVLEAATDVISKYVGLSLYRRNVVATIRNDRGGQTLPYGPVVSGFTLEDEDGQEIAADDYTLRGESLVKPRCNYLVGSYLAGYLPTEVPNAIKFAIMHQGAFMYDNRGSQQQQYANADVEVSPSAIRLAKPYRKTTWLL